MTEFVEQYIKENDLKLETHQKSILKSIKEGKMTYSQGGAVHSESVLLQALQVYEQYKEEMIDSE